MQKGSKNRDKQRIKVANLHEKVANQRKDFLHKQSRQKLVKIDKFFASSQLCSTCGCKNAETKNLSIRAWDCHECGTHHDRDKNAAINIKNEGMRIAFA